MKYYLDCPFCSNKRISRTNSLLTKYPPLASEFDTLSNNGLKTSKKGLYNPETNIRAGALILRYAMDKATNMEDAFYIYTCGEGAVKKRKANGQKKNKATIEITELYYEYSEYFAE